MGESVYIDILVIQNMAMNFFLLYLLSRVSSNNSKCWKLLLAAFIGSLYVVVLFIPSLHILYSLVFKILVSFIMVFIGFTPRCIKKFTKLVLIFYTEAFLLGGGIIGLFYIVYGGSETLNGAFLLSKISGEFIIIGSFITTLFVKIGFDVFESYFKNERLKIDLEVYINGKNCTLKGLIDTGNYLKDPVSGGKVVVSYLNALKDVIPVDKFNLESTYGNDIKDDELLSRLRIIPYKAIGIENGILKGIKTDMIIAKNKNKVKVHKDVTIALHDKSFLGDENFDAIAYPEIIS